MNEQLLTPNQITANSLQSIRSPEKKTSDLVKSLYKDDYDRPFSLTTGQLEIFDTIFKRKHQRNIVITPTQYGKSETISMAVLTRAATFPEKWPIIGPTLAKAKIIMSSVVKHLFENEYTMSRFKLSEDDSLERLRRERSAKRLTFNVGNNRIGEIFILSAESRLKREEDIGNSLMGFGAPNLVIDEAALIDDRTEAKAIRMVGGHSDNFVFKIGNPFRRNHFLKAFESENYKKILIDYNQALNEKRFTHEFIEEMRTKPYFRILYECKFPEEGEIDERGWAQLLTEEDIGGAMLEETKEHLGVKKLGTDVAHGGANYTVFVLRSMNYAEVLGKTKMDNLTEVAGLNIQFAKEKDVSEINDFIDVVGIGAGVADVLISQKFRAKGINFGNRAYDEMRFANLRAEAYWRLREWVKKGGRLKRDDDWYQLAKIRYKPDAKGRVRIMSKEEMRLLGIDSPDVADALALTFSEDESFGALPAEEEVAMVEGSFDPHRMFPEVG